ncbi:MAG: hypothetical protein JSR76_08080 [Verrucomicrobia bacterium]|nr:hypothetical protein [Verrucomicrobiota bacterium]
MVSRITPSEPIPEALTAPIIATLRSSACIFDVRCEVTEKWMCRAYNTFGLGPGEKQDEWRKLLQKSDYQFHKVIEDGDWLSITPPIGFWLKDGRLVDVRCTEGERTEAYYGTKAEIVARRTILFVEDGPFTFLPSDEDL